MVLVWKKRCFDDGCPIYEATLVRGSVSAVAWAHSHKNVYQCGVEIGFNGDKWDFAISEAKTLRDAKSLAASSLLEIVVAYIDKISDNQYYWCVRFALKGKTGAELTVRTPRPLPSMGWEEIMAPIGDKK